MRNLKRVLSTIMAIAMLMSVVVFSASADTVIFTDKEKINHTEAVNMAVALNIINGYAEDNTFRPEGDITRAEMTKMIAVLMHGGMDPVLGTNPSGATFTDIRGHWAEKYIEFCVAQGIVAGMGDGTFVPDGKVTGTQAAKMLLVSLGFKAEFEDFNTSNWATRIGVCAADRKLFQDVNVDPNAPLSRDNAAQMIWNALQAYEVEYTNEWYMDANGNPATRQVARDRTAATGTGGTMFISLLSDKYNCTIIESILVETTWDPVKKVFKYELEGYTDSDGKDIEYGLKESKTDYSDLFAMKVKAVVKNKDSGRELIGMVPNGSVVLAEGVFDDFEKVVSETAVKYDGVKYRAEGTSVMTTGTLAINAMAQNDYLKTAQMSKNLADDADIAWMVKLIDQDGNGRFDFAVYTPFKVGKVTYVGKDSYTVSAGKILTTPGGQAVGVSKSFDFDTTNTYEGIAKDDYVVIYNAQNTPYDMEVIEKMTTTSGEMNKVIRGVTADLEGDTLYIDSSGYTVHPNAAAAINNETVLGNEYDLYQVNGFVFGYDLAKSNYSMDDVLLVSEYETAKGSVSADKAKVFFAKDGTSAIINVDELYIRENRAGNAQFKLNDDDDVAGYKVTTVHGYKDGAYEAAQDKQEYMTNKLCTFSESNGMYILEEVCSDNNLGYKTYAHDLQFDNLNNKYAISKVEAKKDGRLNEKAIAEEAVVFVVYQDPGKKVKVLTGAAAANMNNHFGASADYLAKKVGNIDTVQLAAVVSAGKLPSTGEVNNFGFITSAVKTVQEGATVKYNFEMYTNAGTSFEATVKDADVKTKIGGEAPKKGDVIAYAGGADGLIDNVHVLSLSATAAGKGNLLENAPESGDVAGIGAIAGYNNKVVEFQAGKFFATRYNGGNYNNFQFHMDSDTVFMLVHSQGGSKTGVGAEKGDAGSAFLVEAKHVNGNENIFIDNCVFVADSDGILKLVVVDENNAWFEGYTKLLNTDNRVDSWDASAVVTAGAAAGSWTGNGTDNTTNVRTITYTKTTDIGATGLDITFKLPEGATLTGTNGLTFGSPTSAGVYTLTVAIPADAAHGTNTYTFEITAEDGDVCYYAIVVENSYT